VNVSTDALNRRVTGMPTIAEGNRLYASGEYAEALKTYEVVSQTHPDLAKSLRLSIVRCLRKLSLDDIDHAKRWDKQGEPAAPAIFAAHPPASINPQIMVTMTTIRSRLPLAGKVLESLHNQKLPPASVILNVSRTPYLLDEGINPDDELLRALSRLPLVRVNWVDNVGPYRKILPLLTQHFSQSVTADKLFVTVDDDTIYPDFFLETLFKEYQEQDCIIAFRGRHVELDGATISSYDKWSWGQTKSSLNNLPTGKDGILYSTKFFTRDFLALEEAMLLAPTADDLWIKWHCALNGVPSVVLNPEACTSDYKSFPVVDFSREYRDVSLYKMHNSGSAEGRNDITVQKLEKYYLHRYGYNLAQLIRETQALTT